MRDSQARCNIKIVESNLGSKIDATAEKLEKGIEAIDKKIVEGLVIIDCPVCKHKTLAQNEYENSQGNLSSTGVFYYSPPSWYYCNDKVTCLTCGKKLTLKETKKWVKEESK